MRRTPKRRSRRCDARIANVFVFALACCICYRLDVLSFFWRAETHQTERRTLSLKVQLHDGWSPLHVAAAGGMAQAVLDVLGSANLEATTPAGETALHVAARYGRAAVVKIVAARAPSVAFLKQLNDEGFSALELASRAGHADVVDAMASAAALPLDELSDRSPAYLAAEGGHAEALRALRRGGADLARPLDDGWTPASIAAAHGHAEVIAVLGEAGVDLAAAPLRENEQYGAPCWLATLEGHADVIAALAPFVDVNAVQHSQNGWTPVHAAVQKGHVDVIRALGKAGADLSRPTHDSYAPLHRAAYLGRLECVRALVEGGVEVDIQTSDGATALFVAAQYNRPDIVKWLAARGANVDRPKKDGATPASVAAQTGHADVIAALAESHANLEAVTGAAGYAPVHYAAYFGQHAVVDVLSRREADLDHPSAEGWTPAHVAAQAGHPRVIDALARGGADLDKLSASGVTPFYVAARFNNTAVLRRLARAGVNFDAPDKDGVTPEILARRTGMTRVAGLIESLRDEMKDRACGDDCQDDVPDATLTPDNVDVTSRGLHACLALLALIVVVSAYNACRRAAPESSEASFRARLDVIATREAALADEQLKCHAVTNAVRHQLEDVQAEHEAALEAVKRQAAAERQRAERAEAKADDLAPDLARLKRALDQASRRINELLAEIARSRDAAVAELSSLDVACLAESELQTLEAALPRLQHAVTKELLRREMAKANDKPGDATADSECIVCLSRLREVAFGCGHLCVCTDCAHSVDACPVCRELVVERRRIFSS